MTTEVTGWQYNGAFFRDEEHAKECALSDVEETVWYMCDTCGSTYPWRYMAAECCGTEHLHEHISRLEDEIVRLKARIASNKKKGDNV